MKINIIKTLIFILIAFLFSYYNRDLTRILSYSLVVLSALTIYNKGTFLLDRKTFFGCFAFISFLFVHTISIAIIQDWKNLFNHFAFATAALFIVSSVNFSPIMMKYYFNYFKKNFLLVFALIFVIMLGNMNIWHLDFNVWYSSLQVIGLHKQYLGVFLAWFLVFYIQNNKNRNPIFYYIFIFLFILMFIWVKSLILGMFLTFVFYILSKSKIGVAACIISVLFGLIIFVSIEKIPLFMYFDVRAIYLQLVLDNLNIYPLGIGAFAQDTFLANNIDVNPKMYMSALGMETSFSDFDYSITVLESDFLFLVMNFGYLGLIIWFCLFLFILKQLRSYPSYSWLQKSMTLLLSWYFFAGLTEDYFFTTHWWIFVTLLLISFKPHTKIEPNLVYRDFS